MKTRTEKEMDPRTIVEGMMAISGRVQYRRAGETRFRPISEGAEQELIGWMGGEHFLPQWPGHRVEIGGPCEFIPRESIESMPECESRHSGAGSLCVPDHSWTCRFCGGELR